ncbi:MAG TPA: DciA family protein [Candidatus Saccharimonadales bacterium]|nr:DciA family protein [Candidatus Saccharimonadales bacterium]
MVWLWVEAWLFRASVVKGFSDVTIKLMEPIRSGLRHIMSDFLKTQPPREAPVLAWPVVCGAEIAARTRALEFTEGRLIVEVPDTTWKYQLAAFTSRYISGFSELLGPVVKEVHFQPVSKNR